LQTLFAGKKSESRKCCLPDGKTPAKEIKPVGFAAYAGDWIR
jgi:hypothetical protein